MLDRGERLEPDPAARERLMAAARRALETPGLDQAKRTRIESLIADLERDLRAIATVPR